MKSLFTENRKFLLLSVGMVAFLHLIFMALSGKFLWEETVYNSYFLQARAWLTGSLDLGQDYPWLELAIYRGKYFVSFPLFPSYVLLPFAFFFPESSPEGLVAFLVMLWGAWTAGKIGEKCGLSPLARVWLPIFLYCGTNIWQITVDGWVWFLAQNISLLLTLLSFSQALDGKKGRALFCLCGAVGCRPFQLVWLPLVLLLLYRKSGDPLSSPWQRIRRLLFSQWLYYLPAAVLAGSYLLLNFLRFGNPIEFGHHYLPEFTRSDAGQFSLDYLGPNLMNLFRLPTFSEEGKLVFQPFDGSNFLLVYPIFLAALGVFLYRLFRKKPGLTAPPAGFWESYGPDLLAALLCTAHLIFLCLHKTMGGAHFGNRYVADTLPGIYTALCLGLATLSPAQSPTPKEASTPASPSLLPQTAFAALALLGLLLNFTGVLTL